MKKIRRFLMLGGLAAGLAASAHALDQKTKDAINEAGRPVQDAAQKAATRLEQWNDEQKREFSSEVDATLRDADRLTSKTSTMTASGGAALDASLAATIREQAQTLRERAATLKATGKTDYDAARERTLAALEELQESYFKGVAAFSDQRRAEEAKVQKWLAQLRSDISKIETRAASAAGDGRDALTGAAKELQENHADAQKKLTDLRAAAGDKWAELRTDIQELLHESKQAYWKSVNQSQKQG